MSNSIKTDSIEERSDGVIDFSDIVVIGGGISGLQCTQRLLERINNTPRLNRNDKKNVVILEARDRIGGRINTVKHKIGESEIHVDLGAAWVHGTGHVEVEENTIHIEEKKMEEERNPVVDLIHGGGGRLVRVSPLGNPWTKPRNVLHAKDLVSLLIKGCKPSKSQIQQALDLHEEMLSQISDFGNTAYEIGEGITTTMISVADVLKLIDGNNVSNYDPHNESNIDQIIQMIYNKCGNIDKHHPQDNIIQSIAKLYFFLWEIWQSASLHDLPLADYVQDDLCQSSGDFIGPHCTVNGGMFTALAPLLAYEGVQECIQYNQEVISVSKNNGIITIVCKSGYVLQCHTCIVTIPLACLQQNITLFKPSLSQTKIEAIQSLKMGHYKKIFMTFSIDFLNVLQNYQSFIALIRDHEVDENGIRLGEYLWLDNLWAKDGVPCLEAILVGKAAQSCYKKSTDTIRDAVLNFMQDTMLRDTNLHNLCKSCHVTRWEEDKYTKGAYSYAPIGSKIRHFDALQEAEWDDTLYFAGECTMYEYQGSVHSALLSGLNVANMIFI